jgi:hypothetical protein
LGLREDRKGGAALMQQLLDRMGTGKADFTCANLAFIPPNHRVEAVIKAAA